MCVGHVVRKPDRHGKLYPAKQRPEQKIDAAVALMMAVGRAMAADAGQPDISDFFRASLFAWPAGPPTWAPPPVDARRLERRRRASELQAPAP